MVSSWRSKERGNEQQQQQQQQQLLLIHLQFAGLNASLLLLANIVASLSGFPPVGGPFSGSGLCVGLERPTGSIRGVQ